MDDQKKRALGEKLFHLSFILTHQVMNPMEVIRGCALPQSHLKVLYFLKMHGDNSMSKLSEILSMSKSNMTPVVDGLMEDGLVERYGNPRDRRVQLIRLSDAGQAVLRNLDDRIKERAMERLEVLDEETLVRLHDAVDTVMDIATELERGEAQRKA